MPLDEEPAAQGIQFVLLKFLEIIGYLVIGAALSAVVCGVALWLAGRMPIPTADEVAWQVIVGSPLGYGLVSVAMAVPVWLVGSLIRALRWLRAWWIALFLANALSVTALVVSVLRAA